METTKKMDVALNCKTEQLTLLIGGEEVAFINFQYRRGKGNYQEMSDYAHEIMRRWDATPKLLEACIEAKKAIYEAINRRPASLGGVHHELEQAIDKAQGL